MTIVPTLSICWGHRRADYDAWMARVTKDVPLDATIMANTMYWTGLHDRQFLSSIIPHSSSVEDAVARLKRYQPEGVELSVITQKEFGTFTNSSPFLLKQFESVLQFSWMEATHSGTENQIPLPKNFTVLASHGAEFPFPPVSDSIPAKIATHLRNREAASQSLPKFEKVLCVSDRLKAIADELGANAVFTIPGVDHNQFPFLPIR
ncbi:MAG: hypothetical protein IIB58_10680, partial [Planctomycetes bacterium]|nr:hypothetical protein [Planctomycetota bacterium]